MNRLPDKSTARRISNIQVEPADRAHEAHPEESTINLFAVLYRLLRRRAKLALTLALIGAAIGSLASLAAPRGKYRSIGLIRIRPNVPRILYQSDNNGVMPMFQSFVDSQLTLIKSEPVIDLAMDNAEWKTLQPERTPEAVASFGDAIEVRRPKNSELIELVFTHSNPDVAQAAMHSLINAYQTLHGDPNADNAAQTLKILQDRKNVLSNEYNKLNKEITDIAQGFGTAELEQLFQFKLQEVNDHHMALRETEMDLRDVEATLQEGSKEAAPVDVTPEMIAAMGDRLMRDALIQRFEMELWINKSLAVLGEEHHKIKTARAQLKSIDEQIAKQVEMYKRTPGLLDKAVPTQGGVENLRNRERKLREIYEKSRADLADLGQKNLQIKELREKLTSVSRKLDETSQRIEQLDVESAASGRIEVINKGNRPVKPEGDKRIVWGGAGAVAGGMFGIGIVTILGLLDRRVHNIKDTRDTFGGNYRLLGAVPVLAANEASEEQSQWAALSVHRIRAMLQLRASLDRRVFVVTSAVSGNGKTSLTSALGLSLAGSNSKTLLIDCDVVGGALSIRTNAVIHRKFGQIAIRQGLIKPEQLEQAMLHARRTRVRVGEALVQLRAISEADVAQILTLQSQSTVGLFDVLDGEPLLECVATTRTPGLWILPLGTPGSRQEAQLSPMAIRSLLRTARQHFDIVLIDTGPILGSLDASIVCAEADEVVLVLSRGDDRFLVHKALDELNSLGAQLLGMVFNRAAEKDVAAAGTSMVVSVARPKLLSEMQRQNTNGNGNGKGPHLGPIASAIDASPANGHKKDGNGKSTPASRLSLNHT